MRAKGKQGQVSDSQAEEFLSKWDEYCDSLASQSFGPSAGENGTSGLASLLDEEGNLREGVYEKLSHEQRRRLHRLREEASRTSPPLE